MTLAALLAAATFLGTGDSTDGPPARLSAAQPVRASVPLTAPAAVVIATARGERRIAVRSERGHPVIPTTPLFGFLPVTVEIGGGWATVRFASQPFRFLLDAPALVDGNQVVPLLGGAYVARDTLFVPLQWLTEYIPRRFSEGYRYDPLAARFEEAALAPVVRSGPAASAATTAPAPTGLRGRHTVAIDPGHGGPDAGTRGMFLPRGVQEKHVALSISKRVRAELERRGVSVVMTRTTDTLISLYDRAGYCTADCDLFVSIHVDALEPRPGYQNANGIHTYFLGNPRTGEARRVATLENDALRYEPDRGTDGNSPLVSILKDLEHNEYVRESALLAELVQSSGARVHPGEDKGVQQARFVVLTTARRPAILVETGFGTNRRDAAFLASDDGQQHLAIAIADGIVEYLRRYEGKTGVGIWP
jgi:N-acetylmuramoyl-L-alanine amidase